MKEIINSLLEVFRVLEEREVSRSRVWEPLTADQIEALIGPLGRDEGIGLAAALEETAEIVGTCVKSNHPRFLGWFVGSATNVSTVGDILTSIENISVSNFAHVAANVEERVLEWVAQVLGLPPTASGIFVSGSSLANLLGIWVGMNWRTRGRIRAEGMVGVGPAAVYASIEAHKSVARAVQLTGLGSRFYRRIPTRDGKIIVKELRAQIKDDRKAGILPAVLVATAGTPGIGAIDPVKRLSELAREEGIWFHVDAAYSGWLRLSPRFRELVEGIGEAGSIAIDFHKWMFQTIGAACLLVREAGVLQDSFALSADYLEGPDGTAGAGRIDYTNRGVEVTRRFRALKVYLTLRACGVAFFRENIDRSVGLADHMRHLLEGEGGLEVLASSGPGVVCFRAKRDCAVEGERVTLAILQQFHSESEYLISITRFEGEVWLRAAFANHRTTIEDVVGLVDQIRLANKSGTLAG